MLSTILQYELLRGEFDEIVHCVGAAAEESWVIIFWRSENFNLYARCKWSYVF